LQSSEKFFCLTSFCHARIDEQGGNGAIRKRRREELAGRKFQ
jgi:hypothetical protein